MYLQREITAARELYNDTINEWNKDIFAWPTKKIVAAKNSYTTRIPFVASQEIKQKAKEVLFLTNLFDDLLETLCDQIAEVMI